MPPKKAGGKPKKTATGYRMPDHLPTGTILTDLAKKQWVLGQSVGTGGFGEIYMAMEGGKGEQRVVKIEPHENGPLFVEMHFYIAAGKPEHLQEWKKGRKEKDIPHLPLLRGHGSYQYKVDDNYRFLVIDRLGKDMDKTFKNGVNSLSMGTVASVTVQVVSALEYIHSRGYTHNDVKAANLLLGLEDMSKDVYLVDFGLVVKYMKGGPGGTHKEYRADPRKAHDGTIEYLSRDAHIGCTSRRSDMEVLGYNIIHWLTGSLPWLGITNNPSKVQAAKETFMKDLTKNLTGLPANVQDFMKYVAGLNFEEEPDYDMLRGFFMPEVKKADGRLELSGEIVEAKKGKVVIENVKGGKSAAKKNVLDTVSEKENNPSPVKKARKAAAKKALVVETDSEEEFDLSPVPAKKAKKSTSNKVGAKKIPMKNEINNVDECDDMLPSSPSPLKKMAAHPKYQEASCQTSPAFVAAARAARKGRKALSQSDYNNGKITLGNARETPSKDKNTPSKVTARNTPTRTERSSARNTPTRSERSSANNTSSKEIGNSGTPLTIPGVSNPTPAMLAIMQRKQQAEEEESAKNRKKT